MVMLNGTCLKVKDLSTVLGYGIIMISSSSMLPSFVYLARLMEGFPDVQHMVGAVALVLFASHPRLVDDVGN
jgi:hypothetical protein